MALKDVDINIEEDEILGLIGPNGAGKTTLFNVITGAYQPSSGEIIFCGKTITNERAYKICRMGIARTFQIVRPFLNMTVLENVLVGGLYGRLSKSMDIAKKDAINSMEIVGISRLKDAISKELTLFDRKRVEIATALTASPKLLLLDEPVAGLNPSETLQAMNLIRRIKDELGITVFWIEHVMKAVMEVAERIMVLHHGEKIAEGKPKEISNNEKVIDAYLGEKYFF